MLDCYIPFNGKNFGYNYLLKIVRKNDNIIYKVGASMDWSRRMKEIKNKYDCKSIELIICVPSKDKNKTEGYLHKILDNYGYGDKDCWSRECFKFNDKQLENVIKLFYIFSFNPNKILINPDHIGDTPETVQKYYAVPSLGEMSEVARSEI